MYHAYLLIQEGDTVRATAHRRIVSESATGSKSSERITMKLTIRVAKIVFTAAQTTEPGDEGSASAAPAGEDAGTTLHLSGPVVSESPHVKLGAFHTLDLAVGRDFTLIKPEGGWDSVSIDQIKASTDAAGEADIGAIVCGEGQANVCLITQHTTVVCQRIEVAVPRKRKGGGTALGAEKATARFHAQIYAAVERHFDLDQLKLVIVASPGFVKEAVLASIFAEAARQNNKALLTARPRFKLVHAASHHIHSLTAVLTSPEIAHQLKDAQFAREGMMLDKFQRMMGTDELRAWYGEAHVERAVERGAVGTLLISDSLFKSVEAPLLVADVADRPTSPEDDAS